MALVYIAAPLGHAPLASALARELRGWGHSITSRWHDAIAPLRPRVDPIQEVVRFTVLANNLVDLTRADCVVALLHRGKPKATLCEVGWALARQKPVIWFHDDRPRTRNVFDSHGLVLRREAPRRRRALFRAAVGVLHELYAPGARA